VHEEADGERAGERWPSPGPSWPAFAKTGPSSARARTEDCGRSRTGDSRIVQGVEHAVDVGVLAEEPAMTDDDGIGSAGVFH
jgi:hypothetical protein